MAPKSRAAGAASGASGDERRLPYFKDIVSQYVRNPADYKKRNGPAAEVDRLCSGSGTLAQKQLALMTKARIALSDYANAFDEKEKHEALKQALKHLDPICAPGAEKPRSLCALFWKLTILVRLLTEVPSQSTCTREDALTVAQELTRCPVEDVVDPAVGGTLWDGPHRDGSKYFAGVRTLAARVDPLSWRGGGA